MRNPWGKIDSKIVYSNDWIRVWEDDVVRPDGKNGIYGYLEPIGKSVDVLAVQDSTVFLVRQWFYPIERETVGIVTGAANVDEDLEKAALRELKEETGLIAGKLEKIGFIHPTCGLSNQENHIYLATDLQQSAAEPDETEEIEVIETTIEKAMGMIESREITDAPSVVALQKYYLGLLQGRYR